MQRLPYDAETLWRSFTARAPQSILTRAKLTQATEEKGGHRTAGRCTSSLQAGLKQQAWGTVLLSAPQYSAPRTQPSIPSSSYSVWTTRHIELSSWHHPHYSFQKRTANPAAKLALSWPVCWGWGLLLGLSPTCPLTTQEEGRATSETSSTSLESSQAARLGQQRQDSCCILS